MHSSSNQVEVVDSFSNLVDFNFYGSKNAVCWERKLIGDFEEITNKLALKEDITEVSIDDLLVLDLTEKGNLARNIIISDLKELSKFGAQPTLNLLKSYSRDTDFDFISTDVYSFHVDRSPLLIDTYLCTYYGASSDIIPNEQVTQKILIPEIRNKLREFYDESDGDFDEFLKENFFDLHYQLHENSTPLNLGNGHLWRLAVDHPDQPVLPCVHRAPIEKNNELRLLLIC